MACNCPPCTLDTAALLAKVQELFAARLHQTFHGLAYPCSGPEPHDLATGFFESQPPFFTPPNGTWNGEILTISGNFTILTVQDLTITAHITYTATATFPHG